VPGVTQKQQPGPALMGSQMHLPDLAVTKPCGGGRVRALVTAGLSAVHAGTRARTHGPLEAPSVVEHTARPQPQQQRHSQDPRSAKSQGQTSCSCPCDEKQLGQTHTPAAAPRWCLQAGLQGAGPAHRLADRADAGRRADHAVGIQVEACCRSRVCLRIQEDACSVPARALNESPDVPTE